MNLIFPISFFFTRSFLWLYAFYSAPTLPRQLRPGLPFRYQLLSYFKMLYHGLEVSPPTSIDFPFGTHSFSYRRIEPLASSVEASLGRSSPYKRTSHKYWDNISNLCNSSLLGFSPTSGNKASKIFHTSLAPRNRRFMDDSSPAHSKARTK